MNTAFSHQFNLACKGGPISRKGEPGCGGWRINTGRYHPMFQLPASEIPAAPLPKRNGITIMLQNRLNRPLWLTFHQENGHYQEMNHPILPGQTIPWGQAYLFEYVTEKSMPGEIWRLPTADGAKLSFP